MAHRGSWSSPRRRCWRRPPPGARADGGAVRAQVEQARPGRHAVHQRRPRCASATADVSVLVQDAATHATLLDAQVTVHIAPQHEDALPATVRLSHAAATNKLLQAGTVSLPDSRSATGWSPRCAAALPGPCSRPTSPSRRRCRRYWRCGRISRYQQSWSGSSSCSSGYVVDRSGPRARSSPWRTPGGLRDDRGQAGLRRHAGVQRRAHPRADGRRGAARRGRRRRRGRRPLARRHRRGRRGGSACT